MLKWGNPASSGNFDSMFAHAKNNFLFSRDIKEMAFRSKMTHHPSNLFLHWEKEQAQNCNNTQKTKILKLTKDF